MFNISTNELVERKKEEEGKKKMRYVQV